MKKHNRILTNTVVVIQGAEHDVHDYQNQLPSTLWPMN